ncbi:MAG TPA: hypothetical protein DCM28_15525 [Phycisphaerales bacterium]|nr:hypothetical protein [Phycisphaerales bacterium]HCD33737.1 hypothetical protein [Phycisphaerales bacterium]
MRLLSRMMLSVFILIGLLLTLPVNAGYQIREFETAGTMLYMSFDNASLAGYWKGQTPLTNHEAQITTGALGNSCVAPQLDIQLKGNIKPTQGSITFFTKLNGSDKPIMQMLTAEGQSMMQIGKVGTFLRPWIMLPNGKALGREADTRNIPHDDWIHIAIVWDHAKGIRFYLNGQLASHQWGNFSYTDSRTPVKLEFLTQFGIDELWIFDHPLDGEQINSLRNGRLIPASIIAERIDHPKAWQPDPQTDTHLTYVPYSETIPSWAQSLRKLLIATQQLTGTLEPLRFDPHQPTRLLKAHQMAVSSDKALSTANRRLVNLWQWYTQKPTPFESDAPSLLVKAQPGLAQQMLRSIAAGERLPKHATLNLLSSFVEEGDHRLLDAAITNALSDPTQQLATLGVITCHGQFDIRQLPQVRNNRQPAVTWENMGNDVVARVNRLSASSLHVTLFNFNANPRVITMHPWALAAGQYQLISGPDANDDDMVDRIATIKQWPNVYRGSDHTLTLPGGQTVVELVQMQPASSSVALPDPAIDSQWLTWDRQTDALSLRVINLGIVPSKQVTVELYADGKLLREQVIDSLPATTDKPGQIIIRYPTFSSLGASSLQVRLISSDAQQSQKNDSFECLIKDIP